MNFATSMRQITMNSKFLAARAFSSSSRLNKVGFVGLGNMGAHMARNLLKRGEKLIILDANRSAAEKFAEAEKTELAGSAGELVEKGAKYIVTMLPSNKEVEEVYCGKAGVLEAYGKLRGDKTLLCVDSTTGNPSTCKEVEAKARALGAVYMDTPVSGGVVAARDCALTFMVGGQKQHFDAAKNLLLKMGKNVLYAGDAGAGCVAKICNNMLLGIEMIGVCEALNLGMQMGLDPKVLSSIINVSSGRCWSSEVYNPVPGVCPGVPPSNGYAGGFNSRLMLKDLALSQQVSLDSRQPTPLGALAHSIYRVLCSNPHYASKDFAVVLDFLKQQDSTKSN